MDENRPIMIWMVEDDPRFRQHMADKLNATPGFECPTQFGTVEALLQHLAAGPIPAVPDVLLLDIQLPGMDGVTGLAALRDPMDGAAIVMLTSFEDADFIFEALCEGASGYLLKSTPFEEVVQALRAAHDGGMWLPPPVARRARAMFQAQPPQDAYGLTARETEVLDLMAEGLSTKAIADRLYRSPHTIGNHIKHIYDKLHVHSAPQAIAKSHGFLAWAKRTRRRLQKLKQA